MIEGLLIAAEVCGAISAIVAFAILLIKPIRERVLGQKKVEEEQRKIIEGQKCLLRGDMTRIYYKYCNDGEIKEYEYKNFITDYAAYKALGGNSFIDHLFAEVETWTVVR